ncbi:sulfurtransferase [Sinomonas sp. JGH33]|uniref:Sulfurtransferase n=1 Tax=Sinomonas terricola TaxID=3110330 RepID=A0ABU5T8U9_9MICC|nr:sulfurtransferase [Sinomonas sp. JGH33]MEA5456070.1 sulfurtransferase [Sinomonas sp. JGH33]
MSTSRVNSTPVLISAAELRERREAGRLVLVDVRWALGGPNGRDAYLAGHIPGAVFADLETELAVPVEPGSPEEAAGGRHPLPSPERFEDAARGWGIDDGDAVVVYDATSGQAAARAWWMLRDAGIDDVRILDGGLAAWTGAGGPLEAGPSSPAPGNVTLRSGVMPTIDADGAGAFDGVLLDARAGERFRGEVEPVDPRAGHIPGAVNAPTAGNLADDGSFLPSDALRRRFESLGVGPGRPVAVYCGSGVTAAHDIAALAIAGFDAALYPGSFSQWSRDPERPVAVGEDA